MMIVLILGVVTLSTAIVFTRIGLENVGMDQDRLHSWEARQNVQGCMDELLIWLASDSTYTTSTLVIEGAECDVALISPSPSTRNAVITDVVGNVHYGLDIDLGVDPIDVTAVTEALN